LAPLIAGESDVIDVVDPFLTLTGLKLLYGKNTEKKG
ncbi:pantothenate kinase, partial [Geobacillus stearothermophilus]|nr:pantothenate kinase [Geobacillus stearothermophilus]